MKVIFVQQPKGTKAQKPPTAEQPVKQRKRLGGVVVSGVGAPRRVGGR